MGGRLNHLDQTGVGVILLPVCDFDVNEFSWQNLADKDYTVFGPRNPRPAIHQFFNLYPHGDLTAKAHRRKGFGLRRVRLTEGLWIPKGLVANPNRMMGLTAGNPSFSLCAFAV